MLLTIYEKTRTLSENRTVLTENDIEGLKSALPILTSPVSDTNKIYNLLDVKRR